MDLKILAGWTVSAIGGGLIASLAGGPLWAKNENALRADTLDLVETEKIIVKGPNGSPRIYIGTTSDGLASIYLLGLDGKPKLMLSVTESGNPLVEVRGETAGMTLAGEPGRVSLIQNDGQRRQRLRIRTDAKDGSRIERLDANGHVEN
jgi:hypothetical protein